MIALIERPDEKRIEELGVKKWDVWSKEKSTFQWEYDAMETCYITKGRARVTSINTKESVEFSAGDLVMFPMNLVCTWEILEDLTKHYTFKNTFE